MDVSVLGPLTVDGEAVRLAPRERAVLAALVVRRGASLDAETLAEVLWGDTLPASWAKVVQGCVVRLRKALGAAAIETGGQGYRLVLPADDIDAGRFERLLARAEELLALGEPDRALFVLDEALALWRGRPLPEVDEWEHGRIEAERLTELHLEAEEFRIDAALRAGRHREVMAEARARVSQQPLRERRWAQLALAQYQAGRQAEALRTLHLARRSLVDQLGIDPGPDLVTLEAAILRQDPALVTARLAGTSPVCPYLGLIPYDVSDADSFFGRDLEVAECLRRLDEAGVLAVIGPSGSGKSSLVRAGVAAILERQGHRVVVITPGSRPMSALRGVAPPGPAPALVVDQCEEAVAAGSDADEAGRFFAALAEHAATAPLVVALRADHLGEVSAHPAFARLVERGLYLLKAMDAERLRAAIEAPARQAGLLLEPGLVDLLLRDVEGEPGSLPLLSHALRETWERREGHTLTVAGYRASGGIRGAVAQSAEEIYEQAGSERRAMLRDLMLRLVTPSLDGEPVRSRVSRRVVAADVEREQLVETLVEARLITSDEESVELAHEALARAWPRLRDWLEDDVEGQRIWRHLADAAGTWDGMGRPDSELYRGVRVARVEEWRRQTAPALSPVESDFIEAGVRLASAEQRRAEDEALRQRRINRRLRLLAGGVALLAAAAAAVGVVAVRQARRADAEAAVARSHELSASAVGVMDEDHALAKLLAVAAAHAAEPNLAATAALHRAWATDRSVARYGTTFDVGVTWADLHPEGTAMVVAGLHPTDGSGSVVEVVDPFTDERLWTVDVAVGGTPSAFLARPMFTADGAQVVAGVFWDPYNVRRLPVPFEGIDEPVVERLGAHFWDAATGALVERVDLGRCGGLVAGVSASHVLALTLHGPAEVVEGCRWSEGTHGVELVDRATGERQVLTESTLLWTLWGAALSGDGGRAAYDDGEAGPDGEVVVIDVASGEELLRAPGRGVRDLNGDGSLLLLGGTPELQVWDVDTGVVVGTFDGHNAFSDFARFGPEGSVYSTGHDGALRVWDPVRGQELAVHPGVGNGPVTTTDGGMVAIGHTDRQTVTVLDTRRPGEVREIGTCPGPPVPDSLRVAGGAAVFLRICPGDREATLYVVDMRTGRATGAVSRLQPTTLAVSADGIRVAVQAATDDGGGPVQVYDLRSVGKPADLALPGEVPDGAWAQVIRWSPDGTMVAATFGDLLAVWDASSGRLLHSSRAGNAGSELVDVIFTPDSERLITTHSDWEISSRSITGAGTTRRELFIDGGYHVKLVGFAADGSLVAIGAFQANADGFLHWFDPDTLEVSRTHSTLHEGSIRSASLDPSGVLAATAALDGSARVWDLTTGDLVADLPMGSTGVEGVAFIDGRSLLVTPADGGLVELTADANELLAVATASLTRGLVSAECRRFNFGDACPTLTELGIATEGWEDLEGTYRIEWSVEDLADTVRAGLVEAVGGELDPEAASFVDDIAVQLASTYTLTFDGGRFDVRWEKLEEPYCTGTYAVADGRAWLRSERGSWCYEIKLFDAAYEVDGDELRFEPEGFRGEGPNLILFASRPLQRIG